MTSILDFADAATLERDATHAVRAALEAIRAGGPGQTLSFPAGTYHFWPQRAEERYLFVSNNDESLARIAFPLFGRDGLNIEGRGARFVFHGFMTPFALRACAQVRLTGFTVDWERPFHSECDIVGVGEGFVDLRVARDRYPYRIEKGRLMFLNEFGEELNIGAPLEFDPVRRETAPKVYDNYGVTNRHVSEELAPGLIRFRAPFATVPTPGNVLVMPPDHRLCPAITIGDSRDIVVADVTLHHCGGMGIIAQRTRDIRVRSVNVTPSAGRVVSLTADATHFVNCAGSIEITGCLLENQMDDPTNVHGIYARVSERLSDTELEVELVHPQQRGVDITQAGDTVEIIERESLATYGQAAVTAVERLNKQFTRLRFDGAIPAGVRAGDAVQSLGWQPDLTIRGCTFRGNRARGPLISTAGKVIVEDNTFHTPGAAILIAGDANYWFESGAVRDVTVRRNTFDNCNYGVWGAATIEVTPEINPEARAGAVGYHHNIRIEDNLFVTFHERLVKARCTDGLSVIGNRVETSSAYPAPAGGEAFDLIHCSRVTIAGNKHAKSEASLLVPQNFVPNLAG